MTFFRWIISTEIGTIIRLTWLSFALEQSNNCFFDYVEIFDGVERNNLTSIGKFCGSDLPPTLTSSSNSLTLEFKSDSSVAREGNIHKPYGHVDFWGPMGSIWDYFRSFLAHL